MMTNIKTKVMITKKVTSGNMQKTMTAMFIINLKNLNQNLEIGVNTDIIRMKVDNVRKY